MGRRKGTPATNVVNLVGKRFGKLVVLERVGSHKQKSYWLCQCDCGEQIKRRSDALKPRRLVSCGCAMNQARKPPEEMGLTLVLDTYKCNAKKKNLSFNLSRELFKSLILDRCYYCDIEPMSICQNSDKGYAYLVYNGIYRKDNDLGYIETNVVTCCSDCNYLKNKRSFREFLQKVSKIHKNCINKIV